MEQDAGHDFQRQLRCADQAAIEHGPFLAQRRDVGDQQRAVNQERLRVLRRLGPAAPPAEIDGGKLFVRTVAELKCELPICCNRDKPSVERGIVGQHSRGHRDGSRRKSGVSQTMQGCRSEHDTEKRNPCDHRWKIGR